ncbi:MAG TPA: helix-turn-helix transcriptional regulator [Verrucomicrobiae bacterium]|nr:helix-turn-helix transcriptional regulator [Verrucomicrobiae bacterium]
MAVPSAKDYRAILGATIRKYRTGADFTLERLAKKADLHPNFLGRVERGEEYISLTALRRVAAALDVRVSDLVVGI